MGKGSTWNCERVGHPGGARREGAGFTEEGTETHNAPQNSSRRTGHPHDAVVRLELSHSFIDSFDNHSTASGPDSCIRRRPPGNAVSGHSSTMRLLVWWLSPQGQAGDAITPHR